MTKLLSFILISTALLAGCASNTVSEEKYSGFLKDYSILKPSADDPDTLAYVSPGVDWKKYSNVMVDRILIITPDSEQQTDSRLLVAIADKFQELLKQEISRKFSVVEQAGDGTIRLQAAITGAYTSYEDMKAYQYIPIAAAFTGAARASGAEKKHPRVMTEIRLVDSVNGQLLGQAIDLKANKESEVEGSQITLADVVPILEQWAQRVSERLVSLKASVQ